MKTVLSYIVQKRFSMENENIATEALSFIANSSEAARGGLMKLLREIDPICQVFGLKHSLLRIIYALICGG